MLSIVCAVEWAIGSHRAEFLNTVSSTWAMSEQATREQSPKRDILCFGDSLLKFGFRPSVVDRRSGRSSYNLSMYGGCAPASFFLFRRAIESGARPSAVLIDFEPNLLASSPLLDPELLAEILSPRDCVDLAWSGGDARFLGRSLLATCLPSSHYRLQLRGKILGSFLGQPVINPQSLSPLDQDKAEYRGARVMPHEERPPVAADPANFALFPPQWRCDPINRMYIKKFFALASARNIPVFWVLPPYAPPIQQLREQLGMDATISQFAATLQSRFRGVTVLDARRVGYDQSLFWDRLVHLDDEGSIALSEAIADALGRSLGGENPSTWVSLPGPRERLEGQRARASAPAAPVY
jgi:hypothetical protein